MLLIIFSLIFLIFVVNSIISPFLFEISFSDFLIESSVSDILASKSAIACFRSNFCFVIFIFLDFKISFLSLTFSSISSSDLNLESESNIIHSSSAETGTFSNNKTCSRSLKSSNILALRDFLIHKKLVESAFVLVLVTVSDKLPESAKLKLKVSNKIIIIESIFCILIFLYFYIPCSYCIT